MRAFTDAVEKSKREDVELTQREFEDAMESSRVLQETCVLPFSCQRSEWTLTGPID